MGKEGTRVLRRTELELLTACATAGYVGMLDGAVPPYTRQATYNPAWLCVCVKVRSTMRGKDESNGRRTANVEPQEADVPERTEHGRGHEVVCEQVHEKVGRPLMREAGRYDRPSV